MQFFLEPEEKHEMTLRTYKYWVYQDCYASRVYNWKEVQKSLNWWQKQISYQWKSNLLTSLNVKKVLWYLKKNSYGFWRMTLNLNLIDKNGDLQFDIDLWPHGYVHYPGATIEPSWVKQRDQKIIEQTTLGLQMDQQVQNNIPLFFNWWLVCSPLYKHF